MATILTVVGARPQFVKASPVSRALKAANFKEVLVHTGQHFDENMSDVFFDELGIAPPDHNLNIHSLGHGAMTARMLEMLDELLRDTKPDMINLYGDTNSTLAGALAAAKLGVPVAHVEAGLRSFNRAMPEEVNRVLTDHVSDLLLCPTQTARDHLKNEGIAKGVHVVGDVMYDTALYATAQLATTTAFLDELALESDNYTLATLHRQENTDDPARLKQLVEYLENAASELPMVLPLHPRTRAIMQKVDLHFRNVRIVAPLGYLKMATLVHHAACVYTDSGGLQKEAYFHRVPCITLRDQTEWTETIEAGWNRLWTTPTWTKRRDITEYGNGQASQAIVEKMVAFLGV